MVLPFLRRFPPLMYACALLRLKCAAGEDEEDVVNTFFPLRFFFTVFCHYRCILMFVSVLVFGHPTFASEQIDLTYHDFGFSSV